MIFSGSRGYVLVSGIIKGKSEDCNIAQWSVSLHSATSPVCQLALVSESSPGLKSSSVEPSCQTGVISGY
ncbi:hypothetical protein Mapa_010188 [Marchantia paleacea]|nr:hypothetical protein Mapa_010188 [Marchantia paleacea]